MQKQILEELSNLYSFLYIKHPFYNSIISQFNIYLVSNEKSEEYKIFSDSKTIYIDNNFANDVFKIDKRLLFYFIFHEILHFILLHKVRSISKKEEFWDYACDITVDNIIEKDEILKKILITPNSILGKKVIYDCQSNISLTTEDIYEDLLKNPSKMPKKQKKGTKKDSEKQEGDCDCDCDCDSDCDSDSNDGNGKSGNAKGGKLTKKNISHIDNHKQWKEDNNKNSVRDTQNIVKEILVKADQLGKISKNFGGDKGEINQVLNNLLSTNRSIEDFIYNVVQNFKTKSQSFKRPDRRYLYQGLIAPSSIKDKKHFNLLFYIDTSGSMSLNNISKIVWNIFNLIKNLHSYSFDIIQSDDKDRGYVVNITRENEHLAKDLLTIKGRGGTEISPLFEHLEKRRINNEPKYDVCIVGTDFYINQEDQEGLLKVDKENKLAVVSFNDNCKTEYFEQYKNSFLI